MRERHEARSARGEDGASDAETGLAAVSETETVGDLVDVREFSRRLPGGWGVVAEVAPFGEEPLTEGLLLSRSPADPQLLLKPVRLSEPAGPVEFHERRGGDSEHVLTADSLREAVRVATNWVHQRTE